MQKILSDNITNRSNVNARFAKLVREEKMLNKKVSAAVERHISFEQKKGLLKNK